MAKDNSQKSVVELWGHEFDIAEKGLDKAQVMSFGNELITERELLIQRVDHLSSLTRLAEKTIAEADKLAEEIKGEAADRAKAESTAIIAEAEEQAQKLIEEKRTQIIAIATREAEAIKANAEQEAGQLIEREWERIKPQIRDMSQRLYTELLSQLETLKQQVITFDAEFSNKLPQLAEQDSTVTTGKELLPAQFPANIQEASDTAFSASSEANLEPAEDVAAESQQPIQPIDQTNTSEPEEKIPALANSQETTTYEGEIELEILPPIDIKQLMGIMRYLDGLPEVQSTELIPIADRPLIIASLRKSIPLIDILKTLPEVEQVNEKIEEVTVISGTTQTEGKRGKIQITLFGNTEPNDAKERLESEVSTTLTS